MTRKRTYTGLVGPLRDKLEAVIAEYREWSAVHLTDSEEEVIADVFDHLISTGDLRFARRNIRYWGVEYLDANSPGIFGAALAHAEYIGSAYKKLSKAEREEIQERLSLPNPRLVKVG